MAKNLRVKKNATLITGGWQAYNGPGTLLYAVMDGTSLSSNVLTLYDTDAGAITAGGPPAVTAPTLATWTQDTDFGTTVPVAVFNDGSVVATLGTESADTKRGIVFANGLFLNKTGDTTHNADLTLVIKPLIKKSVQIGSGATSDTVQGFDGPGILHGIRIRVAPHVVTLGTLDLTFKDGVAGGSLRTLSTATDYATAGPLTWSPVTTTGIDDAGSATTTAATGAYPNEGVCFIDGLWVVAAQASAAGLNAQVDLLIEA